jgi:hypothetical protein
VATLWLAHRVMPLKKQVHPRWEYNRVHDPTREIFITPRPSKILELLQEMFQNTSSWPPAEQVHSYHLGVDRDPVRRFSLIFINFILLTYLLHVQFQVLDSFFSTIPSFKTNSDSISAQTESAKSADESLVGHGARSSRTQTSKRKATDTPPQKKKPRKEVWNWASGIKINDPASNPSPAPTPQESIGGRFNFRRSNR